METLTEFVENPATTDSVEYGLDKETRQRLEACEAFGVPKDVRVVHVSDSDTPPKRGIICASGVLLDDLATSIFVKNSAVAKDSALISWRRGFVIIPKGPNWATDFYSGDVYSQRKGLRRFVPKKYSPTSGASRVENQGSYLRCSDLETCILESAGKVNEVWVQAEAVDFYPVRLRQVPGNPVEIDYA